MWHGQPGRLAIGQQRCRTAPGEPGWQRTSGTVLGLGGSVFSFAFICLRMHCSCTEAALCNQ